MLNRGAHQGGWWGLPPSFCEINLKSKLKNLYGTKKEVRKTRKSRNMLVWLISERHFESMHCSLLKPVANIL